MSTGAKVQLLLDEEVTYGTSVFGASKSLVIPIKSESLKLTRSLFSSEALTGDRKPTKPSRGSIDIGGTLELEVNPFMDILLEHVFGTRVQSGANPYTHTFTVGDLPTGLSIQKGFTDLATPHYYMFKGCRINKFSMSCGTDGIITGSIDLLGASASDSTTDAETGTTVNNGHKPFDAFHGAMKQGGSTISIVTAFDFTIENNLDGGIYVIGGGGTRADLPEGKVKVTGNVTALYQNQALYDLAKNNTETSLELSLTKGAGDGTADDEIMTFTFDEVVFGQEIPVAEGQQGVMINLPFEAYYDNDADAPIKCVLMNSFDADAWQAL